MKNIHIKNLLAIAGLVIVAVIVIFFSHQNQPEKAWPTITYTPEPPRIGYRDGSVIIVNASTSKLSSNEYFYFPLGNFEFIVEKGWKSVPVESVTWPKGLTGPQFAIRKEGTSCIFGYLFSESIYPDFKQTNTAERIKTVEGDQMDFWWYAHKDYLPEGFRFEFGAGDHYPHEINIHHYPSGSSNWLPGTSKILALFDENGGEVPTTCSDEFAAMMVSVRDRYESVAINENSQGLLFFGRSTGGKEQLFFNSESDAITRSVMNFELDGSPSPLVYKNAIYFTQKGKAKMFDPFTQKVTDLPLMVSGEDVVNEMYIYNNSLFYLVGFDCNEYRARCNNKLYEYNLATGQNVFLAEKSTSRNILGFDTKKQVLGLIYGDGDAGCYWSAGEGYSFITRKLELLGSFSGCEGEAGEKESTRKYHEFIDTYKGQSTTTEFILINNGKILPPQGTQSLRNYPVAMRYIY